MNTINFTLLTQLNYTSTDFYLQLNRVCDFYTVFLVLFIWFRFYFLKESWAVSQKTELVLEKVFLKSCSLTLCPRVVIVFRSMVWILLPMH